MSEQELTLRLLDDPSLLLILSQKLIFGDLGGMVSARRRAFPPNPIQIENDNLVFSPNWQKLLKMQESHKYDIGYMKRTGSMPFQYTNTDIVGEGCPGARMIIPFTRVFKPWYEWYQNQAPYVTKNEKHYLTIEKGASLNM